MLLFYKNRGVFFMNVTSKLNSMLLSGTRLKECRKAAGLTQTDLISKIESLPENKGKSRNEKHLSAIERGKRALSPEYANLISLVLGVRPEYLLGSDNIKTFEDYYTFMLNDCFKEVNQINSSLDRLHDYLIHTNAEFSYLFEDLNDFIPTSHSGLTGRITIPVWKFEKDGETTLHFLNAVNIKINDICKTIPLNEYLTILQSINDFSHLHLQTFLTMQERNTINAGLMLSGKDGYDVCHKRLKEVFGTDEAVNLFLKYYKPDDLF